MLVKLRAHINWRWNCEGGYKEFFLIIPTYLAVFVFNKGLYYAWAIASFYFSLLGFVFYFRFLQGKWKSMRVIEYADISCIHTNYPEVPIK